MRVQFMIRGDNVDAAATDLESLLQAVSEDAEVERLRPADLPEATRKAIDPISVGALILSIPSAVLAVDDLVERIRKRRRAKDLLDHVRVLQVEKRVEVLLVTGVACTPLKDVSADQLLELATSPEDAGTP